MEHGGGDGTDVEAVDLLQVDMAGCRSAV